MSINRLSFGEHLKQFALSIDFLDACHYELLQQHIKKYLEVQLHATQIAFFEPTMVDGEDGLTTVWSCPKFQVHQTLMENGEYRRQLALAIGERRNLWVISGKEGKHLDSENPEASNSGVDLWGAQPDTDLPPFYLSSNGQPSQTAIVMISENSQGQANGAFLVEMKKIMHPSKVLRREMQLIGEALGLLHATDISTHEQREGTKWAIAKLGELLSQLKLNTGPKPLMFVASSSKAPEDVMNAMEEVLHKFRNVVFVEHWYQMHQPGNINMQLVDEIRSAQYGICYLSEKDDRTESQKKLTEQKDSDHKYRDNHNVLVEAGMLHMVTAGATSSSTGWIPIREKDSPRVPFDLENQRMVQVIRDGDELREKEFKGDLTYKISSLLGVDPSQIDDHGSIPKLDRN